MAFWKKKEDKEKYSTIPDEESGLVKSDGEDLKERIVEGLKTNLSQTTDNIKELVKESPTSYRIRIVIAALLMVLSSLIEIIFKGIFSFNTKELFINLYILFFGLIICILEGDVFGLPSEWKETLLTHVSALKTSWGVGSFLLFVGFFQFSQENGLLDIIVGAWTMHVGALYVYVSAAAGKKLSIFHRIYSSNGGGGDLALKKDFLVQVLHEHGSLHEEKFALFCETKGIPLKPHEASACFSAIDVNGSGKISFKEIDAWYHAWVKEGMTDEKDRWI